MAEIVERPISARAKDIAKRVFRHENTVLIVILIALIATFGVITKGLTISRANMINVLLQSSMRGVAAVGQCFVILTAGIDLSVGGVGLMTGILGASLMTSDMAVNIVGYPLSPYMVIPIMLLVGAAWGALSGSLVSRVGVPALIVTLGMWQITTGVAFQVCRGMYIIGQPAGLAFFGLGHIAGVPVPVIIFIVVAVIAYFVLNQTTFGRSVYAIGGNSVSAWLSGIKVKYILFLVYIISGFLAGLAAVIFTARGMSATMGTLAGLELDTIAAVCIGGISLFGGRGSLIGVVIGTLIIGVINNGLSVLGGTTREICITKGAVIITAVAIDVMRRH